MAKELSVETLVLVSKLYYEDGLTQKEIADILKMSRTNIVNLLNEARSRNIVQIKVVNPLVNHTDLEDSLREKYGLLDAVVIPDYFNHDFHLREIGAAASRILRNHINPSDLIGVGWGKNVLACAKAMTTESGPSNLEWIPLAGGFDYTGDEFQTNEIAKLFQSKLGGHFYPFNFPAIVGNRSIREIIMTDKSTQKIYEKWQNLDAVILGIGVPEANTVVKLIDSNGILTQGAIGEFVANCYDKEGNYCEIENTGFKTGIPFAFLKTPAVRIGIAAEKPKWEAIRVALKSKIINVICTNQSTAEYLLSYNDAASS